MIHLHLQILIVYFGTLEEHRQDQDLALDTSLYNRQDELLRSSAYSPVIHSISALHPASGYLPSSCFTNSVRSEQHLIWSDNALALSPFSHLSLFTFTYTGFAAFRVLSWTPPCVICWTGEDHPIPLHHWEKLEDHLLHLFEDKADYDPEFLQRAQRWSIVFIHWSLQLYDAVEV